jgi:hypothetical protein
MLSTTAERVCGHTSDQVNARILQQTENSIAHAASLGATGIERRLRQLDEEWDIERCLETMAPTITLVGLTLGVTVNKKFLVIPAVVQSFFLQHALQGWCPPLPVLRRLGFRTADEINEERFALKALRGDFEQRGGQLDRPSAFEVLATARRT